MLVRLASTLAVAALARRAMPPPPRRTRLRLPDRPTLRPGCVFPGTSAPAGPLLWKRSRRRHESAPSPASVRPVLPPRRPELGLPGDIAPPRNAPAWVRDDPVREEGFDRRVRNLDCGLTPPPPFKVLPSQPTSASPRPPPQSLFTGLGWATLYGLIIQGLSRTVNCCGSGSGHDRARRSAAPSPRRPSPSARPVGRRPRA